MQKIGDSVLSEIVGRLDFFNYREVIISATVEFIWFAFIYLIFVLVLGSDYDLCQMVGVEYHIPHMLSTIFDIFWGLSFDGID